MELHKSREHILKQLCERRDSFCSFNKIDEGRATETEKTNEKSSLVIPRGPIRRKILLPARFNDGFSSKTREELKVVRMEGKGSKSKPFSVKGSVASKFEKVVGCMNVSQKRSRAEERDVSMAKLSKIN